MRRFKVPAAAVLMLSVHVGHAETNTGLAGHAVTGVIALGTFAVPYFKDDDEGKKEFWRNIGAEVVLNTTARIIFNQTSLGRRPDGTGYGFPSGHVGFVVANAAFLEERYGWKFGLPAYALSGFVAYSRVQDGAHHRRDVIAAGALSYGIAKLFVTPEHATHIAPIIGPDWLGLRWERSW